MFIHQMEVRDWKYKPLWQAFCAYRLDGYIKEIRTSEIGQTKNRIEIHLIGEAPSADVLEEMHMALPESSCGEVKIVP